MSHQVPWNEVLIQEFVRLACLNEDEEQIIRMRAKGKSIAQQAYALNVSESTISVMVKKLKQKYDLVQVYSDILPKRKAKGAYKKD